VLLKLDAWSQITSLVNQSTTLFQESTDEWNLIVDQLSSDMNDFKVLSHRMKARLEQIKKDKYD
jgi:hypothetical protein